MDITITDSDGATGITGYKVSYKSTAASGAWSTQESSEKQIEITDLNKGTEYQFKAQAMNNNGYGEFSSVATATPTE